MSDNEGIPEATFGGGRGRYTLKVGDCVVWVTKAKREAEAVLEFLNGPHSKLVRAAAITAIAPALKLPDGAMATYADMIALGRAAVEVLQ